MITLDDCQRCRAAVRRLYCHYNKNMFWRGVAITPNEFTVVSFCFHRRSLHFQPTLDFICLLVSQNLICPIIIVSEPSCLAKSSKYCFAGGAGCYCCRYVPLLSPERYIQNYLRILLAFGECKSPTYFIHELFSTFRSQCSSRERRYTSSLGIFKSIETRPLGPFSIVFLAFILWLWVSTCSTSTHADLMAW